MFEVFSPSVDIGGEHLLEQDPPLLEGVESPETEDAEVLEGQSQ